MINATSFTRSMLNKYIPKDCLLHKIPPRAFLLGSFRFSDTFPINKAGHKVIEILVPSIYANPTIITPLYIRKLQTSLESTNVFVFQIMVLRTSWKSKEPKYKKKYQVIGTYKDIQKLVATVFSKKDFHKSFEKEEVKRIQAWIKSWEY